MRRIVDGGGRPPK